MNTIFPFDNGKDFVLTNCSDLYNSVHKGIFTREKDMDNLFLGNTKLFWANSLPDLAAILSTEKNKSHLLLSLEQNTPNPFNPITRISFTVPQRMNVKLKVIDNEGKGVAVLTNKVYDSGKYDVEFDGSNLQSGEYLYVLTTLPSSIAIKMVLLK
ncbi:MAG: hypothetical protein AB1394_10395 [Bacteroidota bacterium]